MKALRHVAAGLALALTIPSMASAEFTLLGVHPEAKNQPANTQGRSLSALYGYNNMIYVGYGDYGANTGPIAIRAWDPATNAWTPNMLSSRTEAIYNFREINGRLYAPAIDPKNMENRSYAYTVGNTNVWQDAPPLDSNVTAVHVFDMVGYNGNLYAAASITNPGHGDTAAVYESTDNGTSWHVSYSQTAAAGNAANRIYGLVSYQGKLWGQVDALTYTNPLSVPDQSISFDGASWSTGPSMRPVPGTPGYNDGDNHNAMVVRPITFGNRIVYMTNHSGFWMSKAYSFDGTAAAPKILLAFGTPLEGSTSFSSYYDQWFYDMSVDGSTLYALTYDHHIYTTTDLTHWSLFANVSATARSLTVYEGNLYMGTSDSKLMVWDSPVPEPTSAMVLLGVGGMTMMTRRRKAVNRR